MLQVNLGIMTWCMVWKIDISFDLLKIAFTYSSLSLNLNINERKCKWAYTITNTFLTNMIKKNSNVDQYGTGMYVSLGKMLQAMKIKYIETIYAMQCCNQHLLKW